MLGCVCFVYCAELAQDLEHHRCAINIGWNAKLKGGSERLSNSSKVTQLISIKARDLKTHAKTHVFSTVVGFPKLCFLNSSILINLNRGSKHTQKKDLCSNKLWILNSYLNEIEHISFP